MQAALLPPGDRRLLPARPGLACVEVTPRVCRGLRGEYQSDFTDCNILFVCDDLPGACCLPDGTCVRFTAAIMHWGSPSSPFGQASNPDVNRDGTVDAEDMFLVI